MATSDSICRYKQDTTHFINIIHWVAIDDLDLLLTIDVSTLYRDIPHTESIAAINKICEEHDTNLLLITFICRLVHHILTMNYHTFNGELFQQKSRHSYG